MSESKSKKTTKNGQYLVFGHSFCHFSFVNLRMTQNYITPILFELKPNLQVTCFKRKMKSRGLFAFVSKQQTTKRNFKKTVQFSYLLIPFFTSHLGQINENRQEVEVKRKKV